MWQRAALIFVPLVAGCASYAEAEHRLMEQARKGVALVRQAHQERAAAVEAYQRQQRVALDEAFDEDVRARADLTGDWVIEARKAYAVALDQLARQREAANEAGAATASNLDSIEAALARLQWLADVRTHFFRLGDVGSAKQQ